MQKLNDNECWQYSESDYSYFADRLKRQRIEVSYVATGISKTKFINTIVFHKGGMERKWISDRATRSGNITQVKFSKEHAGKIVAITNNPVNDKVKVLKVFDPV